MSLNTVIKIVFAVGSAAMASGLIKKVKEDAKNLKPDVVSNTILTPTTSVAATVDTQSKKEKQHTNTPFLVLGAIVIVAGLAFAYQKNSRLQQAIAREKQITSERASVAREQARLREQRQREIDRAAWDKRMEATRIEREQQARDRPSRKKGSCWRYINGGPVNICD